jgi:hypothetical protein
MASWTDEEGRIRSEVILQMGSTYTHWVTHWQRVDVQYVTNQNDVYHTTDILETAVQVELVEKQGLIFLSLLNSGHLLFPLAPSPIQNKTKVVLADYDFINMELISRLGLDSEEIEMSDERQVMTRETQVEAVEDSIVGDSVLDEYLAGLEEGEENELAFLMDLLNFDAEEEPGGGKEVSLVDVYADKVEFEMDVDYEIFEPDPLSISHKKSQMIRDTMIERLARSSAPEPNVRLLPKKLQSTMKGLSLELPVKLSKTRFIRDGAVSSFSKLLDEVDTLSYLDALMAKQYLRSAIMSSNTLGSLVHATRMQVWDDSSSASADENENEWW